VNPSGMATIAYFHSKYFGSLKVAYQGSYEVFLPLALKDE
jgi:hypothetical protein